STKGEAAPTINMPAIETGDAEFDIAALAGKAHRTFDQIPDVTRMTVGKSSLCVAVTSLDRPFLALGVKPALHDAVELNDLDLWQVRYIGYLIAEAMGDLVQNRCAAANARIVVLQIHWISRLCGDDRTRQRNEGRREQAETAIHTDPPQMGVTPESRCTHSAESERIGQAGVWM